MVVLIFFFFPFLECPVLSRETHLTEFKRERKKKIRPVAYVDIYAHGRETMERFNEEILTFKPAEEKRLLKIESLQPSDRDDLQQ